MVNFTKTLHFILIFIFLAACNLCVDAQITVPKDLDSIIIAKSKSYIKSDISAQGKIALSSEINFNPVNKNSLAHNYRVQGNLIANIFGFTTPINFSYSNGRTVYGYDLNPIQLPSFNRFGLSPVYKNLTVHVGYRQMNFTKYTLNGHQFKGIGFEYQPEKYYFAFMRGDLKPAIVEDFTDLSLITPSFRRPAWGLKAGYETETTSYGISFLKSKDDINSLENYEDYRNSISPRENAIIGIYGQKSIGEKLIFDFDYAFSGMSYDIVNDPYLDIQTQYTAYNYFGLFTTRHRSIYDKALNSTLTYKLEKIDLFAKYERVDPDFRTLGAFFFNNNFITRTAGINTTLYKEKIKVSVESGMEKIAEPTEQQKNTGRLIGSINTRYKHNDRISFFGKYSNQNNSNLIRRPSLQANALDSIIQTQTKEKYNFGSSIALGKDKNKILNITTGFQRGIVVDRDQFLTERNNISRNLGASMNVSKDKLNQSIAYSIASITSNSTDILSQNLTYNFTKPINELSNLSSTTSLNLMSSESLNNITLQNELSYDFQYKKMHNIKTSLASQIGKSTTVNESNEIFLLIFKINYDLGFNYKYR